MHCEQAEMLIPQYIFNELSSEDSALVAAHLTSCESCSKSCKELKDASTFLEAALKSNGEKKFSSEKRDQLLTAFSELAPVVPPIELMAEKKKFAKKSGAGSRSYIGLVAIFFLTIAMMSLMIPFLQDAKAKKSAYRNNNQVQELIVAIENYKSAYNDTSPIVERDTPEIEEGEPKVAYERVDLKNSEGNRYEYTQDKKDIKPSESGDHATISNAGRKSNLFGMNYEKVSEAKSKDPVRLIQGGKEKEVGNRGIGFYDRVEEMENLGVGGGVKSEVNSLKQAPSKARWGEKPKNAPRSPERQKENNEEDFNVDGYLTGDTIIAQVKPENYEGKGKLERKNIKTQVINKDDDIVSEDNEEISKGGEYSVIAGRVKIITPEEDHRWRREDSNLNGQETWHRESSNDNKIAPLSNEMLGGNRIFENKDTPKASINLKGNQEKLLKKALEQFPDVNFADDDYLKGAGESDTGISSRKNSFKDKYKKTHESIIGSYPNYPEQMDKKSNKEVSKKDKEIEMLKAELAGLQQQGNVDEEVIDKLKNLVGNESKGEFFSTEKPQKSVHGNATGTLHEEVADHNETENNLDNQKRKIDEYDYEVVLSEGVQPSNESQKKPTSVHGISLENIRYAEVNSIISDAALSFTNAEEESISDSPQVGSGLMGNIGGRNGGGKSIGAKKRNLIKAKSIAEKEGIDSVMQTYSVLDLITEPKAFYGPDINPSKEADLEEPSKSKPSEENIKELIMNKIAKDTWDDSKGTSIEVFQGKLIVIHNEDVQRQVNEFIKELQAKANEETTVATVVPVPVKEEVEEEIVPQPLKKIIINPFVKTSGDALSTFSIDTDSASYYVCRQSLLSGNIPNEAVVRPEEFINAFDYNYGLTGQKTFAISTECMKNPLNPNLYVLKVGIKGKVLGRDGRKPVHVVLVVDTSGSMAKETRLPLVKKGIEKLVTNMQAGDHISLVTYGTEVTLNLDYTPIENIDLIQKVVESLRTGGSTDLAKGVLVGYQIAANHFKKGAMNQVMICSDGVANVGHLEADNIIKKVENFKKQGISFTSIGFGSGDYNDHLLEKLALRGDGFYYYVNSDEDVNRVFEKEIGASFSVIAKDAKLQVRFKENRVLRYRLIGYESREVQDKDFRNNAVDGGEIISGKSVTAIYELELAQAESAQVFRESLGTVTVRYQNIENNNWEEDAVSITGKLQEVLSPKESPYFYLGFCAATFAEIMRKSPYVKQESMVQIESFVKKISEELVLNDQVKDLLKTVQAYEKLRAKE